MVTSAKVLTAAQHPVIDPRNKAELDAACTNLGADVSDLVPLLACIQDKNASPQQRPGLLASAYRRLQKLRAARSEIRALAGDDPALAPLLERAGDGLQTGPAFSLTAAGQAYEEAQRHCVQANADPRCSAALRAAQADIAAMEQEYATAAELYAEAAATPGLTQREQWQYQSEHARLLTELGREFNDNTALERAIELYENAVLPLAPVAERPADWAATQNDLGTALGTLGQRHIGTRLLERAIEAFENALSKRDRNKVPLEWAATQNNLGNSLGALAQRHNDTEMLEKSVQAFELALEERSEEQTATEWATTQNNLGAALQILGQRKKDSKLLKRSVDAYKSALKVWTRDRVPLDWAATFDNLGTALRLLGEHRKGPRTLEQSVAAYNNALAERTREKVPLDWAKTQNNLGAAWHKLADRLEDPAMLEKSVEAYQSALREWTRERMPMTWAMTMANLGVAQMTQASVAKDIGIARLAVDALAAAVKVFRSASHAQYTELGEQQLAKARDVVTELKGGS